MAAIIKPLPSGGSDDVTGHEGASCSAPKVYGADFGDVSDWSEEVKDSETADDGDDDEEKSGTGAESPQYVTSDSGGSGEGSDDSVISRVRGTLGYKMVELMRLYITALRCFVA